MRLEIFLKEAKLSPVDFARRLTAAGCQTSEFAVRKWARGERVPRPESMRAIQAATNEMVRPADFIDLKPAHPDVARPDSTPPEQEDAPKQAAA
jgi:hypothetical protein